MSLKPLFSNNTQAENLKTIDENLQAISSRLYCTEESIKSDHIRYLQEAVEIEDAEVRKQFTGLLSSWKYRCTTLMEANAELAFVRKQIASLK